MSLRGGHHQPAAYNGTDETRQTASWEQAAIQRAVRNFNMVAMLAHIVGLVMFVLTLYVAIKAGMNFEDNSVHLHGYMMLVGFILCQGEAIIMYRLLRYKLKIYTKLVHAGFHIAAISFATIGLVAIIRMKFVNGSTHMISFHSWLGAFIYILYLTQFLNGLYTFLFPGASMALRKKSKPVHVGFGEFLLAIAVAQVIMKADSFLTTCSRTDLLCDGGFGLVHHIGFLALLIYAGLIGWLVLNGEWRRRPTPDELPPPATTASKF